MAKRLIVSRGAYTDIDRIIEFNNTRNQSDRYSTKFLKALFKEFDKLQIHPLMGMQTNKAQNMVLIWNSYNIYYQVSDSFIEIKAIYHHKEKASR